MGLFNFFKKKKEKTEKKEETIIAYDLNFHIALKNADGIAEKIVDFISKDDFEIMEAESEKTINSKTRKFVIKAIGGMILVNIYDDDEAANIAAGLENHFSKAEIKDEELKKMLLVQLHFLFCRIEFKFKYISEYKDDFKETVVSIFKLMNDLNGYYLKDFENMYAPDGRLFISLKDGTEFTEFRPSIPEDFILDFEMTEKDKERMKRSIEKVKAENLPFLDSMKVSVSEANVTIPEKEILIKRMVITFCTALLSEQYFKKEDKLIENVKKLIKHFDEKYHFSEILTEREKKYLEKAPENEDENYDFNWRYETCQAFLWMLSLGEMPDLKTMCNVDDIFHLIDENTLKTLNEKVVLKSKDEILDMLDYLYRVNWAAVNARIKGEEFVYNESIIYFRRMAFEWVENSKQIFDETYIGT